MKFGVLAIIVLLSACTDQQVQQFWSIELYETEKPGTKYVKVLGRTWTVYPDQNQPGVYVAQRDNLDLDPYGAPAVRLTPQAVRAIEQASQCRVVRSSLVQDRKSVV